MSGDPAGSGAAHARPRGFLRAAAAEQLRLLRIRPRAPGSLLRRVGRWYVATVLREGAPQLAALAVGLCGVLFLVGAGGGGLDLGLFALGAAALAALWELRLMWLARRSTRAIDEALAGLKPTAAVRVPRSQRALPPLMFVTRSVVRQRGIRFAELEGMRLRLDVYRSSAAPRAGASPAPAVIQVHGGGWLGGSRVEQGIPLLNHLAGLGWVGFNIDYRLSPQASWPDHIVDVKRAIAWVRSNAAELGVDPDLICITGGSAGGHLTALAGLTANDAAFQPGFEDADTSVAAAVPFYGIYDWTDSHGLYYPEFRSWVLERIVVKRRLEEARELFESASPSLRVHAKAPPFLVIHGERDTLVPVADARIFVERLRAVSEREVRYVELPGAEHAFDLWPSQRTVRIADGIGRFLAAVAAERRGTEVGASMAARAAAAVPG